MKVGWSREGSEKADGVVGGDRSGISRLLIEVLIING